MLDHLFMQSDTRFHEPIEFLQKRLSYYLSIRDVIILTDTDTVNHNESDIPTIKIVNYTRKCH